MKSKRGGILFIFIGISVAVHALFLFLPEVSDNRELIMAKEYIPVSLNTRVQPPPAEPEVEPIPESRPEPAPQAEPEPEPEPAPEPQTEPQPEIAAVSEPLTEPPQQEVADASAGQPASSQTEPPPPQSTANPFEDLMHRVNELKDSVYPLKAKKRKYQGTIVVELTLDQDGNLTDAVIVQNCRYPVLDEAAMHLIDLVFIDPYPHNMGRDVVLKMPITFRLL